MDFFFNDSESVCIENVLSFVLSVIAWYACNTLGDVLEDSEAREAALLRRRFFYAVVLLIFDIHKSAHKRRSGLEADDIFDLVG